MGMFDMFGFEIKRKKREDAPEASSLVAAVPPQNFDESAGNVILKGGYSSFNYNLNFSASNEKELIQKYRELMLNSEIEMAVDEIVNEAIYVGDNSEPIKLILDSVEYSNTIKELIQKEFKNILNILNFNETVYEIFRNWYVDGRLYYNIVIDSKRTKDGIQDLRYIDSAKIRKFKEVVEEKRVGNSFIPSSIREFYIIENQNIKISPDSIASSTSGLYDVNDLSMPISYLHGVIKPANQLRMLEDSMVIYYLSRATERRVFTVDVSGLTETKVDQYMNKFIQTFKNKMAYDSSTGHLRDETKTLSIMEDFWFPVRDGRGTSVTTIGGGQNLTDLLASAQFIQEKFFRSLRVPLSRLQKDSVLNTGRTTEIAREEVKFSKFINRLRLRFSSFLSDLLRVQLILKNIITLEDWDNHIKNRLFYDFKRDSHFAEYNNAEINSRRMELASQAEGLRDYYSKKYIYKNFLQLSDEDIKNIEEEKKFEDREKEIPISPPSPITHEPITHEPATPRALEPDVPETPPEI